MTTRTRKQKQPAQSQVMRLIKSGSETKLELRSQLRMTREQFSRLVNVSQRAIADVECAGREVKKLKRPYQEVRRLYNALSEVVDPSAIIPWFIEPNEALSGLKPLEVIERGEIDRLWAIVFRLRSGMPA